MGKLKYIPKTIIFKKPQIYKGIVHLIQILEVACIEQNRFGFD